MMKTLQIPMPDEKYNALKEMGNKQGLPVASFARTLLYTHIKNYVAEKEAKNG